MPAQGDHGQVGEAPLFVPADEAGEGQLLLAVVCDLVLGVVIVIVIVVVVVVVDWVRVAVVHVDVGAG